MKRATYDGALELGKRVQFPKRRLQPIGGSITMTVKDKNKQAQAPVPPRSAPVTNRRETQPTQPAVAVKPKGVKDSEDELARIRREAIEEFKREQRAAQLAAVEVEEDEDDPDAEIDEDEGDEELFTPEEHDDTPPDTEDEEDEEEEVDEPEAPADDEKINAASAERTAIEKHDWLGFFEIKPYSADNTAESLKKVEALQGQIDDDLYAAMMASVQTRLAARGAVNNFLSGIPAAWDIMQMYSQVNAALQDLSSDAEKLAAMWNAENPEAKVTWSGGEFTAYHSGARATRQTRTVTSSNGTASESTTTRTAPEDRPTERQIFDYLKKKGVQRPGLMFFRKKDQISLYLEIVEKDGGLIFREGTYRSGVGVLGDRNKREWTSISTAAGEFFQASYNGWKAARWLMPGATQFSKPGDPEFFAAVLK